MPILHKELIPLDTSNRFIKVVINYIKVSKTYFMVSFIVDKNGKSVSDTVGKSKELYVISGNKRTDKTDEIAITNYKILIDELKQYFNKCICQ